MKDILLMTRKNKKQIPRIAIANSFDKHENEAKLRD